MDAKLPRAVSSPVLRVFPPFRRGSNDPREAISHPPKWPATTYADVRAPYSGKATVV